MPGFGFFVSVTACKGEFGREKGELCKERFKKSLKNSPCDQHRQELVAELRVGHRQAGLGVPRLEHRVEEALRLVFFWFWFFLFAEKGCELFSSLSFDRLDRVGKAKREKKSIGIKVLVYLFNCFLHRARRN